MANITILISKSLAKWFYCPWITNLSKSVSSNRAYEPVVLVLKSLAERFYGPWITSPSKSFDSIAAFPNPIIIVSNCFNQHLNIVSISHTIFLKMHT